VSSLIQRRDDRGVVELCLSRPDQRNALNTPMLSELRDHLRNIREDAAARVVLLTGEGQVFCAGADLKEFPPESTDTERQCRLRLVGEVVGALCALRQPSISLVQGTASGAGWGLAMACDACWATDDAMFSLPEVAKGFRIPPAIVTRLAHLVGPMRVAELLLSGENITAQQAYDHGAVTRIFEGRAEMTERAWAHATQLAGHPSWVVQGAVEPLRALSPLGTTPIPEAAWNEEPM
jgi:methylglutaconyl-CoA hydratase